MDPKVKERTKTAQRLVKNSAWLFVAEALSKIMALLVQVLAARYLGERGYGIYSFAFAFTGAFVVFFDTGLGIFLTREVARKPDQARNNLRNIFVLKWVLTLVVLLAMGMSFYWSSFPPETMQVMGAIGLAMIVNGYSDMYLALLRGLEKMAFVSMLMVLQRFLFLVLGFFVLITGLDVVAFSRTFLLVSVLILIICYLQTRTMLSASPAKIEMRWVRDIFSATLPLCGVVLFTYLYFRADSVLIFYILGEEETGWYSAAFKIFETLGLLIASIRGALFPILSRTFSERRERYQKIWRGGIRYLFLIGIPMSVGIFFLAPHLIEFLFGASYQPSRSDF